MSSLSPVLLSTLKLRHKSDGPAEKRFFSKSFEKFNCFPSNDQHNFSIVEQHTSNISMNPSNLWEKDPAAFSLVNLTTDGDSLSNQYPKTTTNHLRTDLYPPFSSLRPMDIQRKRLRVNFACFQRNYSSDRRVNETTSKNEARSNEWRIPTFVINCSCI